MNTLIYLTQANGNETMGNLLFDSKILSRIFDGMLDIGLRILLAALTLIVGIQIVKLVRRLVKNVLTKAEAEVGVVQFLDSFLKIALYVVLGFIIAAGFGVDAASIVAILGSAGVAVGLALQGSLSNLAGGVLILILKPFKVGDYIKEDSAGNEGTVSEIQMFYTKLRTPDNRTIILPNGTLANTSLTNATQTDKRRIDIKVGISYMADIKTAKEVLRGVLDREKAILPEQDKLVYVDELGESAVVMGVRCWVKKEDYWNVKWSLTEEIKYTLDENGISIPFPQMEVRVSGVLDT